MGPIETAARAGGVGELIRAERAKFAPGVRLSYSDGRVGHTAVGAEVIGTNESGVMVQFDDRAASTFIGWHETAWWNHLQIVPRGWDRVEV